MGIHKIDLTEREFSEISDEYSKRARDIAKTNRDTFLLLDEAKQLILQIHRLQATADKFDNQTLINITKILNWIEMIITKIRMSASNELEEANETSLKKLDRVKVIVVKVFEMQTNAPEMNMHTLSILNDILNMIEIVRNDLEGDNGDDDEAEEDARIAQIADLDRQGKLDTKEE